MRQLFVELNRFLGWLYIQVFTKGSSTALKDAMHCGAVAAGGMAAHEAAEGWLVAWINCQQVMTDPHGVIPLVAGGEKQFCQAVAALKVSLAKLIAGGGDLSIGAILEKEIPLVNVVCS